MQLGINSGFEKINEDLKDNIVDNFNIKDKKINLEDIINKTNKKKPEPEINFVVDGSSKIRRIIWKKIQKW